MVDISAFLGPEFYGFILPFLFTFAIVYGLLTKASMFGAKSDRINAILALVMGFFVTAVGGPTLAAFFTNLFGGASMFLGGILVVILLVTLVRGESQTKNLAVIVITVLIGAFLFLSSSSATGFIGIAVDSTTATLAFALVVILIAIYYITRPEATSAKKD
ncbi:MAG: hypothetical protein HYU56_04430 [Candidatus Aenigmarchaeota archaeon]|nr:hypothetical protein [Candidatus Aenigmarchaeota archaeon]